MKILIAEDDPTSALLLTKVLESDGYEVVATADGVQAMAAMRNQRFDAVLTDWMMPNMDGISLVRRARAEFESPSPMLVITALSSGDARKHAIDAGADDYLAKPYQPQKILQRLSDCIGRANQPMPAPRPGAPTGVSGPRTLPNHVAVGIGTSTGGPEALRELIPHLSPDSRAAFLLVLHGPDWMLDTFTEHAQSLTRVKTIQATHGVAIEPGSLYVCPGDRHMVIVPEGPSITLSDAPPENFVRPSVDPLFRSIASVYGPRGIGVVLTGMGRDASLGAQHVHAAGGKVIVQDPTTAIAASMPRSTISLGLGNRIVPLRDLGGAIAECVSDASRAELPASV